MRRQYGMRAMATAAAMSLVPGALSAKSEWRINLPRTALEHHLNETAKLVCSAYFVSGFDLAFILREVVAPPPAFAEPIHQAAANARIEGGTGIVELASGPFRGRARFFGDQGCVLLPDRLDTAYFTPQAVRSDARPSTTKWEDGRGGRLRRSDADQALLDRAADLVMTEQGHGAAFLVVHRGRIVTERYGAGVTVDTALMNWSMGKSILGAFMGILVQEGAITVDQPAPIDEWRKAADDPRGAIRILDLLQMSSGLSCSEDVPEWQMFGETSEHLRIYSEPIDILRHAILRPAMHPPSMVANYSNCDMQALGTILRRHVEAKGGDYLSWPYRRLYDPVGMTGMVSEVDTYGSFHLTGFDHGTARDWARFGQLHLNDGMWNGQRILPTGWARLVATPALAWEAKAGGPYRYGGAFWLNSAGEFPLPRDAYFARGAGGNLMFIVPSLDVVTIMLRHNAGTDEDKKRNTQAVLRLVTEAVGGRGE